MRLFPLLRSNEIMNLALWMDEEDPQSLITKFPYRSQIANEMALHLMSSISPTFLTPNRHGPMQPTPDRDPQESGPSFSFG